MASQIITFMVMATAIPSVHDKGWMYFALAYAVNRMITASLYHRTKRMGVEESLLANKISRNFYALAVMFAISAFMPTPYGNILFDLGIVTIQLLCMLPKVGVVDCERILPRLGHMSECCTLLLLIVVGEFFLSWLSLYLRKAYTKSDRIFLRILFSEVAWVYAVLDIF